MRSYILPLDQKHHQEELENNLAIPKSYHSSYSKNKAKDSKRSYHHTKGLLIGAQTMTRSKAHITGPKIGFS